MCLVLMLFASVAAAQKPEFQIDSITVEGNRILSAAAIRNASGLKVGMPGSPEVFDAARDRLLATGYFETISYRYKPADSQKGYEVTFTVAEETKMFPVRVDALGVGTQEILDLLKTTDPLFTGRMPATGPVIERSVQCIEQVLKARGLPARVSGRVVAIAPGRFEIQFTPERGVPAVSSVTFTGSRVIGAAELRSKIAEVAFGQPFTEDGFRIFLDNRIRPLYEAKGYMNVTFPKVSGAPAADLQGVRIQGVDVNVTVDEGDLYKLSKATIDRGTSDVALPDVRITSFDQVRGASDRILKSMQHQGYLDADVSTEKQRDDAAKTVAITIAVDPGPQYRMGRLIVNGLGLDGEAAVRRMWSVKTGDPFPAAYPEIFVKRMKGDEVFENLADVTATPKIDAESHVVDMDLDFKTSLQRGRKP